jgi:fucose permease
MSILFALPGVIISKKSGKEGAKNLNILYSFMSIGVVSSPLISGVFIKSGFHYPATYFIIVCAAFIGGTASAFAKMPVIELGEGFTIPVFRELLQKYRGVFILVIGMSLCYMGSETIPNNWIPEYLKGIFPGYSGFRSRIILSLFWASITVGRYVCAAILNFWKKPKFLLLILSIMSAVCLASVPAGNSHKWAEVMFILTGLFFSGMIPIIFSFTDFLPEKLAGTCFILILTIGMLGASGANKAFGLIAAAAGFRVGIVISAIPAVFVFILTLCIKKNHTSRGPDRDSP